MNVLDGVDSKPIEVVTRDEVLMRPDENAQYGRYALGSPQRLFSRHCGVVFDDKLTRIPKIAAYEPAFIRLVREFRSAPAEEPMILQVGRPHGIVRMKLCRRIQSVSPICP